ncbi:MAG: hypothetical protein ABIE42_07085 [Candidatus Eisenbacteria bacterium]
MIEPSRWPTSRQQWWLATSGYQAAARFTSAETRATSQEFAMTHCPRRHPFAVVFLALFGLLFFVSPAGAQLMTIFEQG